MSLEETSELKEVGCDYITATARETDPAKGLYAFGRYLLSTEARRGFKTSNSRGGGYYAAVAGHVWLGRRFDGCCLRVSGAAANEHWNQVADLSGNVTRFDVQVTEFVPNSAHSAMLRVWNQNRGWTSGCGHRSKVKKIVGPSGIETMFVGSRQSERFLRIYDKYAESGEEYYRGCLRWELELKADLALAYANNLSLSPNASMQMFATVRDFCLERLKVCPSARIRPGVFQTGFTCLRPPPRAADCNRTLQYLAKSIKPSIDRLKAAGLEIEVRKVLGLE